MHARSLRDFVGANDSEYSMSQIETIESLEEISDWLGTFRERLRIAREHEKDRVADVVRKLEAHHKRRRAELS